MNIFYSNIKVEDSCSFTLFGELHARVSTGALDVWKVCVPMVYLFWVG